MSLYPSLEDMKVVEILHSQAAAIQGHYVPGSTSPAPAITPSYPQLSLYPSLASYMGLDLATVCATQGGQPAYASGSSALVAPVSSANALGIKRAEIKPGMRKVVLCKDGRGKLGVVVKEINKGVFVACVFAGSASALAGLRFGDQILEINGQAMAGYTSEKASNLLKKSKAEKIEMVIRDRPFERIITLNKDSNGYVGFCFKDGGKIVSLVKDSSAARNGLLIEHQLVEVDGRCVVGMKDKEIQAVVDASPRSLAVTIMPSVLYEHMVKCIGASDLRKHMDHSVPDI